MKKLLIVLLFFGFSFGQDKTLLVGVWDCISCSENNHYRHIFNNDGSSTMSVSDDSGKILTSKSIWENIKTKGNDLFEEGVLTVDFNLGDVSNVRILQYDYNIIDYQLIEDDLESKTYLSQYKSDIKNDILFLFQQKKHVIFERK